MASTEGKLNIAELDFTQIKENLIGFLQNQSEFVGYNFRGSSFDVLLDVLAYNTHYNAYYANMVANEMFLDSATLRNSVVARSKHLGYLPRSAKGSKASVNLTITPSDDPAVITIPRFTQFQGDVDGINYIWCTSDSHAVNINANLIYTVSDVELTQGIPISYRYTAATADVDQRYLLPNANIDTDTLTVTVQTSETESASFAYDLANDITTVNSTSKHYFLDAQDDGLFEVQFGDGILGKEIANGNIITLAGLVTDAGATNGCKSFSVVSSVGGYSNVQIITSTAAGGGVAQADIEEIKFNAPKNFDAQNRCVTVYDYVSLVKRDYPAAQSVVAWGGEDSDPPIYGKVYIAIKPRVGNVLSTAAKERIERSILAKRNVVGVTSVVVDPDYVYLGLDSTVKYDSSLTSNSEAILKKTVTSTIRNFGASNLKDFDKAFRYSNIIKLIDEAEVSIKSNQTAVSLKRYLYPLIGSTAAYTLKFSNEIYHPSNTFWGSITSSKFSYRDTANTVWEDCRFQDENGYIQVYRKFGIDRILVANNIGTITYSIGQINLTGFLPEAIGTVITGNTEPMTVSIIPASSDIKPVREQILLMEDSDISVTMLDDSPSGTYIEGVHSTVDGSTLRTGYEK
tara:strand:+ start:3658 stop:5541 length:1884 start_codon:yes stop_codon:yes gene_type:complete